MATIEVITNTGEDLLIQVSEEQTIVNLSDVGSIGKIGLVFRGDYSSSTQYYQGDAVRFNNFLYLATEAITLGTDPSDGANPPTTNTGWGLILDTNIAVDAHGNMPGGSLQTALNHLEDKQFIQAAAPTGSDISKDEGDLWYDTTNNQMKTLRNDEWEVITFHDALNGDFDSITVNGGTF